MLRLPIAVTVHLPPYYFTGKGLINTPWGLWFYKKAERVLNHWFTDRLIYASFQVMEEARDMGLIHDANTVFIGNGVNLGKYTHDGSRLRLRQEMGIKPEDQLICWVGRLDQQKGLDILLEAFSWLRPSPSVQLWLAGDGPLFAHLREQTRRLGALNRVQFLGFRTDIPQLLQAADIFVLPSRYEAMPLSIIEAMAAGLPCIVSDTGENALMIENEVNGLIVPIEDVKSLADAMERLLEDPQLCRMMGRASLEKSSGYSNDITVRRIQQIYEIITNRAVKSNQELAGSDTQI
jgi:glycosyltransferase involved in cell wall biosynthesis